MHAQISTKKSRKPGPTAKPEPLAKGQLWRMVDKHLEIVEMGKRLMHYRLLTRLDQRGVPVRLGNAEEIEAYLRTNKATLVRN